MSEQSASGRLIDRRLADEGRYVASESSFHRVLRASGQSQHRGRAKRPVARREPTTHTAHAPSEVWCWDVTWLPTKVNGLVLEHARGQLRRMQPPAFGATMG